jgi:hypothetical protein
MLGQGERSWRYRSIVSAERSVGYNNSIRQPADVVHG